MIGDYDWEYYLKRIAIDDGLWAALVDPDDVAANGTIHLPCKTKTVIEKVFFGRSIRREAKEKLDWFSDLIPGKDILDVGCGRGEQVRVMKAMGARFVMGIDWSPVAIRLARRLCAGLLNVQLYKRDAVGFHPGVRFDVVTMFDFIEHLVKEDAEAVYSQAVTEWLRPGGWLCVICPPKNVDPTHLYHQTQGIMRRDMEAAGFEIESLKEYKTDRGYIYVARARRGNESCCLPCRRR